MSSSFSNLFMNQEQLKHALQVPKKGAARAQGHPHIPVGITLLAPSQQLGSTGFSLDKVIVSFDLVLTP